MAGYIYYGEILIGRAYSIPCTITFSVNPNDAEITVNGNILSGNTYTAEKGEIVSYSISKYGYGTETGSFIASTDETVTVTLVNYLTQYLTFDIVSDGTILWKLSNASGTAKTISYRKNNGSWTSITSTTAGVSISVTQGDKVEFKGTNTQYGTSTSYFSTFRGSTAKSNIYGNIMSLIYGDNFIGQTTISANLTFTNLIREANILSSRNLILPATTLTENCYRYMFAGNAEMVDAPALPATTLAANCCSYMFSGCASLTTAPELPATSLADSCYYYMFRSCASLTTAPNLPATILAYNCYRSMFYDCISLITPPEFGIVTTGADQAFTYTFMGCTSLTQTPNLESVQNFTNYITGAARGMFYGCFKDCTSLTTITYTPDADLYIGYMFDGCENITSCKVKQTNDSPGVIYADALNYCFNGCAKLSYVDITEMRSGTLNTTLLQNWLNGVAATGTIKKLSSQSLTANSVSGIPTGWTTQDASS